MTNQQIVYPLPQSKGLRIFASIISYVFHPLFIPIYVGAYLIYVHPYVFAVLPPPQKFIRFISIVLITAFFPGITVFLLWRLKFAKSIFLRTQQERIIPYVASIIYFWWAFYVSRSLPGSPLVLTYFFLGLFLAASAALMANNYFKVSMHGVGAGGLIMYFILLGMVTPEPMGIVISIATLVAGMVCTARLLISDHHPAEVYWGFFIGVISQAVAYWFIM